MHLKFIQLPKKKGETPSESMQHCSEYSFKYLPDTEDTKDLATIVSILDGKPSEFTFWLGDTEVYVMNEQGKTIDRFNWKRDDERKRFIRM